jgi:glutamate dehydrogenase (NAD(P)+)
MGTDSRIMGVIANKYISMNQQRHIPHPDAVVTGKPVAYGSDGVPSRTIATALGGLYVLEELRAQGLLPPGELTAAVQGFGNAGANFALLASKFGFDIRIVAATDSKGGVYNPKGLSYEELARTKKETGSLMHHAEGDRITNEDILQTPCDILVPAAVQNVITAQNAALLRTRAILELANGPTDPQGTDIAHDAGILCIPDILANAGGVSVSYLEWLQNTQGMRYPFNEIAGQLKERMRTNHRAVIETASRYHASLRLGANHLAIERLFAAFERKHSGKGVEEEESIFANE